MDTKKIGAFLKSLVFRQEPFPDGRQDQICQILVYWLSLLIIMTLK